MNSAKNLSKLLEEIGIWKKGLFYGFNNFIYLFMFTILNVPREFSGAIVICMHILIFYLFTSENICVKE